MGFVITVRETVTSYLITLNSSVDPGWIHLTWKSHEGVRMVNIAFIC